MRPDDRRIWPALVGSLIFVLVTCAATAALALTIANSQVGVDTEYRARFTNVSGLVVGDDIRIAGVRIGKVDSIEVVDRRVAEVAFSLEAERTLPASVLAVVRYRNLVGQRYIELSTGAGRMGETLKPGDTIPVEHTKPALDLTELFNGFQPLFQALSPKDVNQLSGEIIAVLQGEGSTVDSLVAHTASLATTLAAKDQVIGSVIQNLNAVLSTVTERGDALGELTGTLQQLVSGLAADRQAIGGAVGSLSQFTGTATGLLSEARQPLQADIAGLGALSQNLNKDKPQVEQFLQNLPAKYQKIGTLASYGSWLNLYLCEALVTGVKTDDGSPPPMGLPVLPGGRCGR
ncbi:MCE family protein [Pseudonocardiaceae bacterium YIM PH 21723]|nr:MCE family protein [Pseudonocardiaceae bacterium YIM PH 21723]